MSTPCRRAMKQASGQSLQMLADINDPFLFRRTLTPRSANLFQSPLCLPWSTSIFPMLKHVKPRCLPTQPDPFWGQPPGSAAAVAATSARPRSNAFIEAIRQGASKGARESVRCLGVEAVTPLRVPNAVSWPIRYILALTSCAVIRGLTLWHAEMNSGGETIAQPTRDIRFPAQGCSIYF
jgi:hypothetical protein